MTVNTRPDGNASENTPTISIDMHVASVAPTSSETLGMFLARVAQSLPPTRVVAEVAVDGKKIAWRRLLGRATDCLEGVTRLEIRTADRHYWIENAIPTALAETERLGRSLLHAATLVREGLSEEGSRLVLRCAEGLERALELLSFRADGGVTDRESLAVSEVLARIEDDRAAGRWSIVADRIEYELLPHLHVWRSRLEAWRSEATACAA
jgi:hypothetical protein